MRPRETTSTRRCKRLATAIALVLVFGAVAGTAGAAARIDSIAPAAAGRGAQIELRGGGFGASTVSVWVGGEPAQVLSAAGNRVTFTVPNGAPFGPTIVVAANRGEQKTSAPFTVIWDGHAVPLLASAQAVSATIGHDGGWLESQGVRLDIPSGALSEPVGITLTPLTGLRQSPLDESFIGGARLEPEGLVFLKAATLSLPLPDGVSAPDVLGFGSAGDGSGLHLAPHELAGGRVTLEVWHFSAGGASSGGATAAAVMQGYTPTAADGRAMQRIAAALPACAAERAAGQFNGPACTRAQQETIRALFDWYINSVKPNLQAAVGALSTQVDLALQEWLSWKANVEARLNGELDNELAQAGALASDAVAELARTRLNNCTGTSLISQFRDVARVVDYVEAGEVDLATEGLPEDLFRACAHLEIDITEFPPVAARFTANTLRGRVFTHVYNGPDRNDVPLTLTVGGSAVSVSASGEFQTTITPAGHPLNVTLEAEATATELQNTSFNGTRLLNRPVRDRIELQALAPVGHLSPGSVVPMRVKVAGDGMSAAAVSYSVSGIGQLSSSSGTTNALGETPTFDYTVPGNSSSGTGTVTAALGSSSVSLTTTVNSVAVTVSPATVTLNSGQTRQFTATVTGTANTAVTWTASGGTITGAGLYTAGPTPGNFSVTAQTSTSPVVVAGASVTIVPAASVEGYYSGVGEVLYSGLGGTWGPISFGFFCAGGQCYISSPSDAFWVVCTFAVTSGPTGGIFTGAATVCDRFHPDASLYTVSGTIAGGSFTFVLHDQNFGDIIRYDLTLLP